MFFLIKTCLFEKMFVVIFRLHLDPPTPPKKVKTHMPILFKKFISTRHNSFERQH